MNNNENQYGGGMPMNNNNNYNYAAGGVPRGNDNPLMM